MALALYLFASGIFPLLLAIIGILDFLQSEKFTKPTLDTRTRLPNSVPMQDTDPNMQPSDPSAQTPDDMQIIDYLAARAYRLQKGRGGERPSLAVADPQACARAACTMEAALAMLSDAGSIDDATPVNIAFTYLELVSFVTYMRQMDSTYRKLVGVIKKHGTKTIQEAAEACEDGAGEEYDIGDASIILAPEPPAPGPAVYEKP